MTKVVADRLDIRQNALTRYMTIAGYAAQEVGSAINELIDTCAQSKFDQETDKGAVYLVADAKCGVNVVPRLEITVKGNQIVHVSTGDNDDAPFSPSAPSTASSSHRRG